MRIGILCTDGMFDSGLTNVLDVLATANQLAVRADLQAAPFEVHCIGLSANPRTAHGLQITTRAPADLDGRLDLLITPALGMRPPEEIIDAVRDHPTLDLIRALYADGVAVGGACSGTFYLAEAGLLDGVTVTTSWWLGPAFRARYLKVDLDESRSLVSAGRITTAGAAFAHIDLALALVHQRSPTLAALVARYLVVGDRPSQAAMSVPADLASGDPTMTAFEREVRDHLADLPRMGEIARAIGVSERTLQRTTTATMGMSPVRFVQEIRLDHALFLCRTTARSAESIAQAVGYRDAGTLRELIRRRRGVTFSALRRDRPGWASDTSMDEQVS